MRTADPPLSAEALRDLYRCMVLLRRFELAAQKVCRDGELPGFVHLYLGQEAVAAGVSAHLRPDDWITSTHRGHGHALAKGTDPGRVMAELYGRADGCCGGRGGTMHLYDRDSGLFGTNGIVAAGLSHAVGLGIASRRQGRDGVAVAYFGDGAVNHGAFHESLNLAAANDAPVLFVCENNLYATATPFAGVTRNPDIASRAAAYGLPGVRVDGNDVLAVWLAARDAIARARSGGGPTLIEALTYRIAGHHEGEPASGGYRTAEEVEAWRARCPIASLRTRMLSEWRIATVAELDAIEAEQQAVVDASVGFARASPIPDPATVALHVTADPLNPPEALGAQPASVSGDRGWLEAVREGIAEAMRRDPHILYLGEGTGARGGAFAQSKGLFQEFGGARVTDMPISEAGFTGAGIGASAAGCRTIVDLMFVDFAFEAAGQIVTQAAKLRYMTNGRLSVPVVLRMCAGAHRNAGPHHSGSYHPMWAHVPGLVVVLPSTPADAKGLMRTALRAADPVLFLEGKSLFASRGPVPDGEHFVPFGVAALRRAGRDITIVSAGQMVGLALEAAETLAAEGIEAEVIDLRTIQPFDLAAILGSVRRTHRLLVVDEAWPMCGFAAEVAQSVQDLAFDELDAPIGRLTTRPITHPFAPSLEAAITVNAGSIVSAARGVVGGRPPSVERIPPPPGITVSTPLPIAAAVAAPARAAGVAEDWPEGEAIRMPFGDLTVSEGRFVRWLRQEGDVVAAGDAVAEVETDKAVVEIEAPTTGRLSALRAAAGVRVAMGQRIAVVARI
jgi:2-oxoisovalerate dehydrogenase E1 component